MDLLNKLTIKNLKLNKKRTIVTIIGIILSTALITALASLYTSAIESLITYETSKKGNYHIAYYDVPKEEIKIFKNNRAIENYYLTRNIGYAKLKESKNEYKPYAYIKEFTKSALDNLSVKLIEGRMPNNKNEILIPSHLKTNGRINLKVGDTLSLDVGRRISEGFELDQTNPFDTEIKEEIIDTTKNKYKIVGIIERPDYSIEGISSPGYTLITYLDENELTASSNKVDVYTRYNKSSLKNYIDITAGILGVDEKNFKKLYYTKGLSGAIAEINKNQNIAKYNVYENQYLISLETNPIKNSAISGLGNVVIIVCIIIIVTSVFCIKNSFDISITEKIKQYGMLRSVGATKKQIKKNVLYEAFILGVIGIPLGILCGLLAAFILIWISDYYIAEVIAEDMALNFDFSIIAILVSIILGIITIYLSSIRSAKKASRISPIDSIKNSANIQINKKKIKCPKLINKIFGVGGTISYKNIIRNKKKYRTTIISIFISATIFISLSSFMNIAMKSIENQYEVSDYNLSLLANIEKDNSLYEIIKGTSAFPNIKAYTIYRNTQFNIENPKYSEKYIKTIGVEDDDIEFFNGYINVSAIGEEPFKRYIKSLGLNYNEVKDKAILLDEQIVSKYNEKKSKVIDYKVREFSYEKGATITGLVSEKEKWGIEIAKVTNIKPLGLDSRTNSMLIINDKIFDKIENTYENVAVYFDSSNPSKLQDDIDEALKGYNYNLNNSEEQVKMMKNLFTLIGIFLYGFIIVISLIGITNIFNTITTSMELRKQEFAMFKSIGMTNKEFNKMIRLESIFIGIKSLIFAIPLGIGISYLIYYNLGKEEGLTYSLPTIPILITIIIVFILISIIMKYSIKKINKQNTIETIRNENI